MKINLSGKTAIITGGIGCIGMATARAMAECGANIVITDRTDQNAVECVNELKDFGVDAMYLKVDVTDQEACARSVYNTAERYGSLDILMNNAGYNTPPNLRVPIFDLSEEEWLRTVDININGIYYMTKPASKVMSKQKCGAIINISSITALVPLRNQQGYAASKAAIANLTKAMAIELAEYGIRVNGIVPGSIMNPRLRDSFYADPATTGRMLANIALKRPGRPDEIASVARFLACDEASYMTGNIMIVDGGWITGDIVADPP